MLNILCYTLMTSRLRKLVRVCIAVISLTAFSHRIFKHRTIVTNYFTWKYHAMLHFLCRCSYLFTFIISSQFYWHIRLKSTVYFFWPTLYCGSTHHGPINVYPRNKCAGWAKNCTPNSLPHFSQSLTDLQNSFTGRFSTKFALKWLLWVPPHLAYVATLPRKTF